MRLEQITLHGFKSFAERTALKVLPGITAIVGPNGCGKSNVAEAVRWALGEQSAKSARPAHGGPVHGSASRKAVGLATVDLLFSNDGTLAVPWTEIAVTRRLYRTGESEYLLNQTTSRLRDILDLFAGTGANPRAYSIMDQDKLNHVLTAKPHEWRVFIEEAAGIARYKQQRTRRRASWGRLARTRAVRDDGRGEAPARLPEAGASGTVQSAGPGAVTWRWRCWRRPRPAPQKAIASPSLTVARRGGGPPRDASARRAVAGSAWHPGERAPPLDLRQAVQKVQGSWSGCWSNTEQLGAAESCSRRIDTSRRIFA
jgi:energy-coupling factor transporter ATP-binding protein EcfA2